MTTAEDSTTTMTMAPRPELTLIVAATSKKMGIGLRGTLPWMGLKREMAYFARVSKRGCGGGRNAVIMGRKTWDSIPPKFRPLKERRNIVVSRSLFSSSSPDSDVEIVSSIEDAIKSIGRLQSTNNTGSEENSTDNIGRAFIIGGAQIYKAALERPETKRILLTRILGDFECDTFFPVVLGEEGSAEGGWKRRGESELGTWTGEGEGVGGEKEEGGTKYVFEMWEREG